MRNRTIIDRAAALLLAAVLVLSLCPAVFAQEGDGDGTAADEIIYIRSMEDLLALAKNCTLDTWSRGRTVELESDLSLEGTGFTPIPSFGGTFNGNGHTISGLHLTGALSQAGLFRTIQQSGVVRELNVSGTINVSGSEAAGGIAAVNYGRIGKCSFSGSVSGGNSTGALVGRNAAGGAVWSSTSAGTVGGSSKTGGIAGENLGLIGSCTNGAYVNTTVQDRTVSVEDISLDISFDRAKIGTGDALLSAVDSGGIAGYSSGVIRSCENSAIVGYQHVGYNVGGIVGRSCGYILSCVNSGAVYGRKDVGGIVGQMEPYIEMTLSQSTLETLQTQLDDLNGLVDRAIGHAEGGAAGVSSRLNSMSDYVQQAASAADDMQLVIDAGGTVTGSAGGGHETDVSVTPGSGYIAGGGVSGGGAAAGIIPGAGAAGGASGAAGGITAGGTSGSIDIDGSGSADGRIDGSAQVVATPDLGGLTSAVNGIDGQLRALNGAVSGTTGVLASDMRAINEKFSELSNTLFDAIFAAKNGSIISDTSETDVERITLGKIAESRNTADISGDANTGGIAGSMAMEYALDPENDVSSDISAQYRREYELKAVIQRCTNSGAVTAKRSYAGGICGRMDLGLITGSCGLGDVKSENGSYVGGVAGLSGGSVRGCYAKCTLGGKKYVGGIVGSGITEGIASAVSTVSGCGSMVEITDAPQYAGSVSGAMAGEYLENVFVSDTLAGIDGQSYGGKAEPISYEALLAREDLPEEMRRLRLRFSADGVVLLEREFDYGDSFSDSIYPDIPQKDGYYAVWDRGELNDLRFDTSVTAVYIPYTTTVSADAEREDGKPVFLVEGDFDEDAVFSAQTLTKTTTDFAPLSDGLVDAVKHYLRSTSWYLLPVTPVNREVTEQWHIELPEDENVLHTVHYISPDGKMENLRIYVRQGGGWKRENCESFGSYLTFSVSGTEADVAAVSVLPVWWAWLLLGLLVLLALAAVIFLIRKLARTARAASGRKKEAAQDAQTAEDEAGAVMQSRKKKSWPVLLLLALLAVLAAAAAYLFLFGGGRWIAYHAMHALSDRAELSMTLTVDAAMGGDSVYTQTVLQQKSADGQKISYTQLEGVPFYYADGAVILESGSAYQVHESFPDYPALLTQLTPLFKDLKAERSGDAWTVTAEGRTAQKLLTSAVPALSGSLSEMQSAAVRVRLDGLTVRTIELSAEGTLQNGLALSVSVCMDDITGSADFDIPQAVLDAATDLGGDRPVITEDSLTLLAAWEKWRQQESGTAKLSVCANCGPVVVDQSLDLYVSRSGKQQIYCISKDGISLYWNGERVVRQDGTAASEEERRLTDSAQLLDILYLACQRAEITKTQRDGADAYAVRLDGETMDEIAAAIAPETSESDVSFDSGSLTVCVTRGELSSISFRCTGSVRVVVLDTAASLAGNIEFVDRDLTIPESAARAL